MWKLGTSNVREPAYIRRGANTISNLLNSALLPSKCAIHSMQLLSTIGLAALAGVAHSKEVEKDAVKAAELYDSGVIHQRIMDNKHVRFAPTSPKYKA